VPQRRRVPAESEGPVVRPGDVTSAAGWAPGPCAAPALARQVAPSIATLPPASAGPASTPAGASAAAGSWRTYSGDPLVPATAVEGLACRQRECLRRARRTSNLMAAGLWGAMVIYGISFFDYGSSNYQVKDDGWFEKDNKDGGSDKAGHATSTYIQTAVYAALNRSFGIPKREAALRGALTAWSVQFLMEVGDGFSEQFGSSWTDLVANTAGATFGYFQEISPRFNRLFDLRWEYWPSDQVTKHSNYELSTDIEGSSYVLALNLGALYSRHSNALDYFDLQLSWASRHYKDHAAPTERLLGVGVGLNLTNICRRLHLPVLARFFEYYQPPGISLRWETDLNK
jgi:uncharacterized protein YfiM (DUF2279 family)